MEAKRTDPGLILHLKLHPHSGRDRLVRFQAGVLKAEVAAPPRGGRANRSLINLLSESLGIPKSSLNILQGEKERRKLIAISGLTREEFFQKLKEKSLV